MKKAIVIGSSTGIGKAISIILSKNGYRIGLAGRNKEKMEEVQKECVNPVHIKILDVQNQENAIQQFKELVTEMSGCDLVVINAGTGYDNEELSWEKEKQIIHVNVLGFTALADESYRYFFSRQKGHIVGISSIAGIRGGWHVPSYNASKAFMINYMEGLRLKAHHDRLPIIVTDIRPGFVDTPLTQGRKNMFWVSSAEEAAIQIYGAIKKKKNYAYITSKWRMIAWFLKWIPECVYKRVMDKTERK